MQGPALRQSTRLVTRRERPEEFMRALQRQPTDIKVVVQFAES
jgi:hypothetical protein